MSHDPIVDEVDAIKEQIAAEFDFDVRKIIEDAIRRQSADGHPLITRGQLQERKRAEPVRSATET
jgi:hypothetical protein